MSHPRRCCRPTVKHAWHKRRWRCAQRGCPAGAVTEQEPEIAPERERLTTRAGRWATRQAGRGRPAKDVAEELGCSWHPVNMSVRRWGEALLDADAERIRGTEAPGLDEHLMWRRGRFRTKASATSIVDVGRGQLLDIVAGRTAQAPTRWLLGRPRSWLRGVRWAVLDLSGPYRAAFDAAAPHASQVADPFHVVRLANDALDEVRRRVQNQTLGHRGHKHDPLYRARKLLVSASENITDNGRTKLRGLLDSGDPYGEVRDAWHAKETLRSIYDIADAATWAPRPWQPTRHKTSRTPPCPQRSTGWAAPSGAGDTRSPTGTPPESPTPRPRPPTINRGQTRSNAPPSGSPTSTTTGSEPCSTPANPTGPSSTPSLPP